MSSSSGGNELLKVQSVRKEDLCGDFFGSWIGSRVGSAAINKSFFNETMSSKIQTSGLLRARCSDV